MKNKWKIFLDILTAFSIIAIIIYYIYPNLTTIQKEGIYIFDLSVLFLLVIDFYKGIKKSELPLSKFLIKQWYEIPSMMPLILFSTLEQEFIIGTFVRGLD